MGLSIKDFRELTSECSFFLGSGLYNGQPGFQWHAFAGPACSYGEPTRRAAKAWHAPRAS